MKITCEIFVWEVLLVIRKEFTKSLIKNHSLTQWKIAKKLGLTEAAISRYIADERGKRKKLNKEIHESTSRICNGNNITVVEETCRICNIYKTNNLIDNNNGC